MGHDDLPSGGLLVGSALMQPDFPGAIWYPAHETNTLGPPCIPKGVVVHTPEEPADGYPGTPVWFAQYHENPNQRGSTHYFVSYLGFVFQCVPENVAPIANGVLGKPYPAWADPGRSLNRQTWSVEVEGYAATIRSTLSAAQRNALLALLRSRCAAWAIPLDRQHIIGHYEVANNRTDPGTLDIDALVADALLLGEVEEDMAQEDWVQTSDGRIWRLVYGRTWLGSLKVTRHYVTSIAKWRALCARPEAVRSLAGDAEAAFMELKQGSDI